MEAASETLSSPIHEFLRTANLGLDIRSSPAFRDLVETQRRATAAALDAIQPQFAADVAARMFEHGGMQESMQRIYETLTEAAAAPTLADLFAQVQAVEDDLEVLAGDAELITETEDPLEPWECQTPRVSTLSKLMLFLAVLGFIHQGLSDYRSSQRHAELVEQLSQLEETVIELVLRVSEDGE